jgi:hypothetical protein
MRVNVTFEMLKGGRAHLVSVGTSYAMNVSEVESQPQERNAVTLRPSAEPAEPKDAPTAPAALSTFGLGESSGAPNAEPARSEPGRPASTRSLPNVLVTATLSLGAAIALWWARRAL